MAALALAHVSVWLDDLAPDHGAFAHGLEWATQLRLPLEAFAPMDSSQATATATRSGKALCGPPLWCGRQMLHLPSEVVQVCESACQKRGIPWRVFRWQEPASFGIERFLRPLQLCVLGIGPPSPGRQELLTRALHSREAPVLICPPTWQPVARILIVNERGDAGSFFLDSAAQLCQTFASAPVVLTVARSEHQAQERQLLAEEHLACHGLPADFDCLVGGERAAAVAQVARWRRCSHVFVERPRCPSWWSWLRGHWLEQLLRLAGSLTILAIPRTGRTAEVREPECAATARRLAWGLG